MSGLTARSMYEHEFEAIWNVQAQYYPELLTPEFRSEIARLLFYQRPIASQQHLIGFCELEKTERRAPWWNLEAQRFRILQKLNDLEIVPSGQMDGIKLSGEQSEIVLQRLEEEGDQKFSDLKKLLKLPPRTQFNLERGDEKRLRGNRINALMVRVFGSQWQELASEEKTRLVRSWAEAESPEELIKFGTGEWALSEEAAKTWSERSRPSRYRERQGKTAHRPPSPRR
jgi:CRISPR-associated endonuclease Csn1